MSSKDRILARIREALRETAPLPGHDRGTEPHRHESDELRHWLPAVGPGVEEQAALFAQNSAELKTELHRLPTLGELGPRLAALARECGWSRVATHEGTLTTPAVACLGLPTLVTDGGYQVDTLEACDAGITECDALVAQTGSVLVTARSAGGRALSVLPPHHVVLATRAQLVPDLAAAYAIVRQKYGATLPSFISFITGPSRTGDIERILVLGAHGPKRLTVLCADAP